MWVPTHQQRCRQLGCIPPLGHHFQNSVPGKLNINMPVFADFEHERVDCTNSICIAAACMCLDLSRNRQSGEIAIAWLKLSAILSCPATVRGALLGLGRILVHMQSDDCASLCRLFGVWIGLWLAWWCAADAAICVGVYPP
jgi:hypothetical protein